MAEMRLINIKITSPFLHKIIVLALAKNSTLKCGGKSMIWMINHRTLHAFCVFVIRSIPWDKLLSKGILCIPMANDIVSDSFSVVLAKTEQYGDFAEDVWDENTRVKERMSLCQDDDQILQ
ncbi:hypothetical protein [Echinococcus multilocularis]|uniref:Uncharacterized protein n=1 Tax=Echinococcus multilocularis TaxID=6211 RepID=A0A068Y6P3_ECHMU|nr:hypothetical protein [Echinococcus multilocularis]